MTGDSLSGGCLCGAVRYRAPAGAADINHCHCEMCRKIHGAVFVTWAKLGRADFIFERGAEALAVYESTPDVRRSFCRTCGSPILLDYDGYPDLWLAAGTLDNGSHPGRAVDGAAHIFVGSKAPWETVPDGLPQYDGFAGEPWATGPLGSAMGGEGA